MEHRNGSRLIFPCVNCSIDRDSDNIDFTVHLKPGKITERNLTYLS